MTIFSSITIPLGRLGWLYAQEHRGQKLHTVEDHGPRGVNRRATCGREPRSGQWRMTINIPLGLACGNCTRIGLP